MHETRGVFSCCEKGPTRVAAAALPLWGWHREEGMQRGGITAPGPMDWGRCPYPWQEMESGGLEGPLQPKPFEGFVIPTVPGWE